MVKEIWKMVVKGVFVGIVYPVANTLVSAIPISQLKIKLFSFLYLHLQTQSTDLFPSDLPPVNYFYNCNIN